MKALLLALVACSAPPPKTPASMLAHRLADAQCRRICPVGEYLVPLEYRTEVEYGLADCCVDPFGLTWSSCAWNGTGRFLTRAELMDPARLKGDCGGDGYPDCEVRQ